MGPFIDVVAARLIPEYSRLDAVGRERFSAIVDRALASKGAALRLQVGAFLFFLRWSPLLRCALPFDVLSPRRQDRILRWCENNPLRIVRTGFWGVKVLVCMGFYGRPEHWERLGYRPDAKGNVRLHASA